MRIQNRKFSCTISSEFICAKGTYTTQKFFIFPRNIILRLFRFLFCEFESKLSIPIKKGSGQNGKPTKNRSETVCSRFFLKDLFSHLQLQFSLQGLFNYFFTACKLNETSLLFSIHTVLPSVMDVSGAILSIILPNFCLLCVCVSQLKATVKINTLNA